MPEFNQKSGDSREKDFPYIRRLWNTIVVALLAAAFIPLMLIGGGMYYFSGTALKQKTMESLRADVLNHKNAVDLFLTERALDLKQFAGTADPASLALPGTLATAFQSLQASGDKPWFTDLGIIDDQGRHLAYIGPYDLTSKNYKATPWFKAVMERGEYISDVFPGFRKVPHFVIAVKQRQNGNVWIIRAALLESLDQIRTETHRGIKSLDRIHSVTQPPTGIIEEIDVNNLLDDLIKLFAREMHFKNIEKIRDFYNQPLPIRSDSSQVSQVFQNLIFNAISALQKGAMIILKTRRRNRSIQVVVVADINLEFFQVRLLLDFLIRGTASNLFACVVDNKIEGLVYLAFKERYFYKALEIRYIATVRGAAADRSVYRPRVLKGVGTFLVAGVWLLWKSEPKGVSDLLLDSEIGARRFYDGIGFPGPGDFPDIGWKPRKGIW